jgi:hypothetical protein
VRVGDIHISELRKMHYNSTKPTTTGFIKAIPIIVGMKMFIMKQN